MVLKKSKITANTGNTQRKYPFLEMHCVHRNGLIRKKYNTVGQNQLQNHKRHFNEIDGGIQTDVCFSMKKKQRWLIPELIKEQILEMTLSTSHEPSVRRKSKKQEKKASQSQEENATPTTSLPFHLGARAVLIENSFTQRHHKHSWGYNDHDCEAVYDSADVERPVKKSKSW